jgi:hypothetical protein
MLYLFSFIVGFCVATVIFNKPIKIEIKQTYKEEKDKVSIPIPEKPEQESVNDKELNKVKQEVYAGIMNEFYGMDVIEDGQGKEKD